MRKIKISLLCLLASAALYTSAAAVKSLHDSRPSYLPGDIYESFLNRGEAEYYLKSSGGYVAVFRDSRCRDMLRLTSIETSLLRRADRAMLSEGIPVRDKWELLELLEDLGS